MLRNRFAFIALVIVLGGFKPITTTACDLELHCLFNSVVTAFSPIPHVEASWLDGISRYGTTLWQQWLGTPPTSSKQDSSLQEPADAHNPSDEQIPALATPTTSPSASSPRMTAEAIEQSQRFRDTWNQLIPQLEHAAAISKEMEHAPNYAIFIKDKRDFQIEFDDVLDRIISLLEGTELLKHQRAIRLLKSKIDLANRTITYYQEARIGAPRDHWLLITQAGYDRKIAELHKDIANYEKDIVAIQHQFVTALQAIGLNLNLEQAQVLLARVDGDNILQMAIVFDTLKVITQQLMQIMSISGESVDYIRYYGMHVVLLEMMLYMQNRYIDYVDKQYLPKLEEVISKTIQINKESFRELRKEADANRREVYRSNIKAHQLTLNTAKIYMGHLKSQRQKVQEVRAKIARDLTLARNTYATVTVSSELLNILQASQDSFDTLMRLQAPEIVPFENNQILKKFEELSSVLSGES